MPYLGTLSDDLSRELRKYGYRVAFYPLTQIWNLSRPKDPIPKLSTPGVYRLTCGCGDQYIGQTGRSFQERFKEHSRDYNNLLKYSSYTIMNSPSAMARHCRVENHPYNEVVASPLYYCSKGRELNSIE